MRLWFNIQAVAQNGNEDLCGVKVREKLQIFKAAPNLRLKKDFVFPNAKWQGIKLNSL